MTSGSDVDHFVVSIDGRSVPDDEAARAEVSNIVSELDLRAPSGRGAFNDVVPINELISKVGGDAETNTLLTRRILLLLESRPILADANWKAALDRIRAGYLTLGGPPKDYRPPRFLLNDVVRYWRTMCVDFEGKMRGDEGDGWGVRNAKLRTVRKMLFAGGLLPLLECARLEGREVDAFLAARFAISPIERVAEAAIATETAVCGADALRAYGDFLSLLDNDEDRQHLTELRAENRGTSDTWAEVKAIGARFQKGLLGMLSGDELRPLVQEYTVF